MLENFRRFFIRYKKITSLKRLAISVYISIHNWSRRKHYKSRINTANNNWLDMPIEDVIESILDYFEGLVKIVL